jgi:hypothetical protein
MSCAIPTTARSEPNALMHETVKLAQRMDPSRCTNRRSTVTVRRRPEKISRVGSRVSATSSDGERSLVRRPMSCCGV